MKKLYLFLIAVFTMVSVSAGAQIKFGVKGGLNVTNMSVNGDVFDASNRAGWFIGPTVKISIPLAGLGVDASLLYDSKTADVKNKETGNSETSVKQQQLAIPVNLRYSIGLGSTANVFFFAGPQWGINIGDKNFKWSNGSSYSLKKSN